MSNLRSISFLSVAIIALAIADFALSRWGQDASGAFRRTLIEPTANISRISIRKNGSAEIVIREGNEGVWRFVSPFAGPADRKAVMRLCDRLAFTPIADTITDSQLLKLGRTRDDFSLSNPESAISLQSDDATVTITFGSQTPSGDKVYAAVDGVDSVFLVPTDLSPAGGLSPDAFRPRTVMPIERDDVRTLGVGRNGGNSLVFVRDGNGWTLGDTHVINEKIESLLDEVLSASAIDFVWPLGVSNEVEVASAALLAGFGLDAENAISVTVKGVADETRKMLIGKDASTNTVYALVQNGNAIVTVPRSLKDALSGNPALFTDSRLFPVKAESVSSFSIADGEVTYVLARTGPATDWRIESPIVAPADTAVVETLLGRILGLSPSDLDETGLCVSIATNVQPVRVVRKSLLGTIGFESLRSLNAIRIDASDVKRLVRTDMGSGSRPSAVVYERDLHHWNVEASETGTKPNEKGIASVLSALSPLRAVRVEKIRALAADMDDYGLDRPFLTISIDFDHEGSVRRNLLVGGRTKGGRFATIGSSDAVFVLSDEIVKILSAEIVKK